MWKTYKKEIMEKEKKEADFLKKYYKYQTNKSEEAGKSPQDSAAATENQNGSLDEDEKDNGQANIYEEDDWPVQVSFCCFTESGTAATFSFHLMLSPRKTVTFLRLYQSFPFDKLKAQQQQQQQRVHSV